MESQKPYGLCLLKKERKDLNVLKDLLQLMKTHSAKPIAGFAYVEAQTSLIPNVSLKENLQIELGFRDWREFSEALNPECRSLVRLLKPETLTQEAQAWEKLITSFVKAILNPAQNLLVDMNEDLLSPLMLQQFKKSLLTSTSTKNIYLASANDSLWFDCAHSLVSRKSYEFVIEKLDSNLVKRHWAA